LGTLRERDYISRPKEDGYRSIQFVASYREHKVEMQIRSRLQHQWASAVETIDLFTNQNLKGGKGKHEWKRFFLLTANLFALREARSVTPGMSLDRGDMINEVRSLWSSLRIVELLNYWLSAMNTIIPIDHGNNVLYLIEIDVDQKTTHVKTYSMDDVENAFSEYNLSELFSVSGRTSVLVSAHSIDELREALPAYYGDTTMFLSEVGEELGL
jgi:hypothetical protein